MRLMILLFISVPLIEMWLLIEVGGLIGAPLTILAVVATAMIGLALLRRQGASTLLRAHRRLDQGELPAVELIEGFALAIGGALLLTPGFMTDVLGFSCLIPWSRRRWAELVLSSSLQQAVFRSSRFSYSANYDADQRSSQQGKTDSRPGGLGNSHRGDIIDGEYSRDD